jgi:hypothetical protein
MSSHSDSFAASGSSPTRRVEVPLPPDFLLENYFSIHIIRPLNETATAWLENNIDAAGSFQPYWPTVVVEPRYVAGFGEEFATMGWCSHERD